MKTQLIKTTLLFGLFLFFCAASKQFLLGNDIADLGLFEQFTWLIANGGIHEPSSLIGRSALEDHFSLLLIPIAFTYKIIPSSYTLIGLQSIALSTLPYIAYRFSSKKFFNKKILLSITIAIILCPYVFLVNLANFHPEVITAPFMLLSIFLVSRNKTCYYYLFLMLSLFAKKAQVLFGIGLGLYALIKGKTSKGVFTFIVSIIWWLISSSYSQKAGDFIQLRLGYLGESNIEIIKTLVTSPWNIFSEAPPEAIFLYTLGLLLPFLALINKRSIPALIGTTPFYLTNIISSKGMQRELDTHYSIGILPFIIVACVDALEYNKTLSKSNINKVFYTTILLSIIAFSTYSRAGYFQSRYLPRAKEAIALSQIKPYIKANASILTNDNYVAQFSNRRVLYTVEKDYLAIENYDYLVFPGKRNLARVNGKLKVVEESTLDERIIKAMKEAKSAKMHCYSPNKFLRICSRETTPIEN